MADTDNTTKPESPLAQALARLSGSQKIGLMVAIAAIIAIVAGSVMWGQTPEYRVLYSNLSDRDGGAIIESLQQMNVPYKFTEGGGAVLVPASQVHEARLKLASQGLPKGGNVGFELMENQKFGTSQFLEQVNYQRALEGELARSVQTLASVQSARVHLAIPKPTVFVKDQQKPSASVILSLHAGRVLDPGQVSAIVHLISSSVPEMSAKSVTLVDQNGTLLSAMREGGTEVLDASQLKYLRQIEQDYVKRIQDIIAPLVGTNNVRAQVTADLDFSQSEQTAESYGPNQPPNQAAVRSQQSTESVNNAGGGPAGVPGALSNQPPVPATAPIVNPASSVASSNSATSSTHKEATTNFEVDRTIRHTKLPVGSIKRMSVAVVVNHRTVTDKKGNPSTQALSDEEKAQITALVKEAMGYDEKRGDSLEVINSPFTDDKEVLPDVPLWKQPGMVDLAKELLKYGLIAGVMLALIFMVIRPAVKNLTPPPPEPEEKASANGEHVTGTEDGGDMAGATSGEGATAGLNRSTPSYENHVQAVKQLAQQDPKIVATVVKEWVNGNE